MSRRPALIVLTAILALSSAACVGPGTTSAPTLASRAESQTATPTHRLFGLYVPRSPANPAALAAAETQAGCHAGLTAYFEDAASPLSLRRMDAAGSSGSVPFLTLEMHTWRLTAITAGRHDKQIVQQAHQIARYQGGRGGLVYIRMNHEMNGVWYPWSEASGANPRGSYAAAWRHVVNLVRRTGTGRTTLRWVWAPNLLHGARSAPIISAYPGDAYVDDIGTSGYGDGTFNRTPAQTYDPTLTFIRQHVSATKPIIISESGVLPGRYKVRWTAALGPWLLAHPSVVAFVWFDFSPADGANWDYRFTPYPAVAAALRRSLRVAQFAC